MANYLTNDTELTSVANAIRTKGGTSAQLTFPTGFVSAINAIPTGGGGVTNVTLSGEQPFGLSYGLSKTIMQNPNIRSALNITTENLTDINNMCYGLSGVSNLGFDLNFSGIVRIPNLFNGCYNLTTVPNFNYVSNTRMDRWGCSAIFQDCHYLTQIPDIFNGIDLEYWHDGTGNINNWFNGCSSVETISSDLLSKLYNKNTGSQTFRQMFNNCYCLKRINNFGVFHPTATVSSDIFNTNVFGNCYSLTSLTFSANGAARNYSHQVVDLTTFVGWDNQTGQSAGYNVTGGLTLGDSVYNHDSAVETINSLPDCSAVSPPSAPTNIIKFAAGSGANTTGGDISNLTAAEIAVATNKGWQVVIQ